MVQFSPFHWMDGAAGVCVALRLLPVAWAGAEAALRCAGVVWLDAVTYLHHHGQDEDHAEMPWCARCLRCTCASAPTYSLR